MFEVIVGSSDIGIIKKGVKLIINELLLIKKSILLNVTRFNYVFIIMLTT